MALCVAMGVESSASMILSLSGLIAIVHVSSLKSLLKPKGSLLLSAYKNKGENVKDSPGLALDFEFSSFCTPKP